MSSANNQVEHQSVESLPSNVPMADLQVINLGRLYAEDESEVNRLLRAAVRDGFFYLDLRGLKEQHGILDSVNGIFSLSEELFGLEEEEKLRYDVDSSPGKLGKMKLSGYGFLGSLFDAWPDTDALADISPWEGTLEVSNYAIDHLVKGLPIIDIFLAVGGKRDGFESYAVSFPCSCCYG